MTRQANRHLQFRGESWRYERRIPADMEGIDTRWPSIRTRLTARTVQAARLQRDVLAMADDNLWAALRATAAPHSAWEAWEAQQQLARAIGLEPVPSAPLERMSTPDRMAVLRNTLKAAALVMPQPPTEAEAFIAKAEAVGLADHPVMKAASNRTPPPPVTLSDALRQYFESEALANRSRSPQQIRKWMASRDRAVRTFIAVHGGDPAMDSITRDDALAFVTYWRKRVISEGITTDMARKDLSALRSIYTAHFDRLGEIGKLNPFDGLTLPRDTAGDRKPFSVDWLTTRFLTGDKLASLNAEARAILLILVETGARPSEICNLVPEAVKLDGPIPHIVIAPRQGRALKARSSKRTVPLVGVALAAMMRFPKGFPRYLDKEDSLSAVLMKHLKANDLLESPQHSVYSLRHAYVDRLRAAGIGDDLRRQIVGHAISDSHGGYGAGFTLAQKAEAMASITLPYDPQILL